MLNLPPGVSSSAPSGFVTFPLQKIRAPICAQSIKSAGNRRVAAASLQEMHNGSFALLSNRVNELKLPTICSPPKESARDEHSLCNGWTCRNAALQDLLQRVVELGGPGLLRPRPNALAERMRAVVFAGTAPSPAPFRVRRHQEHRAVCSSKSEREARCGSLSNNEINQKYKPPDNDP